ncbi:curli production assembly/transport component CsgG [Hymenobacter sp. RP-2-7]|uniref:Curli production assembly/transport component CsgG n=1 Tax=Hymenobacter polaris TaxID=2682546 RepID=A0A7Y0AEA7_9BACT|nr:CsgG/HfaB family protein [Hymenobacter polaris]NML65737.1 curli production assembly/transport component CsgG [Hymenobacter polaris]
MPFSIARHLAAGLLLALGACTPYLYQHPLATQPARLGAELRTPAQWGELPAPLTKTVVAVYKFRDQTGQYKPQENGASFSTAVTQGATTILVRALEESKWFEPIERENLGNLLNERKIIRSTRQEYTEQTGQKQPNLPPLLFAGVILEGGIISYDTNIITGGAGLRYFGAGASGQYRQDRVTVYLRAVSTGTGKVLKTVYTSKTILSQQIGASLFQFVAFKRLLETETGFTYNEPSELAVKDAIEKSVQALIYEGFDEGLWLPRDSSEVHGAARQNYLREKAENLNIDVLGRQQIPRRTAFAIGLAGAVLQYQGDYASPNLTLGAEATARIGLGETASLFLNAGQMRLAAGANRNSFNSTYNYAEGGVLLRILPRDRFTPYVLAGGGATVRTSSDLSRRTLPHVVAGIGAEYLLTPRLGLSLQLDNHYYLNDELDGLVNGRYNDYYWGARAGIMLYLGRSRAARISNATN